MERDYSWRWLGVEPHPTFRCSRRWVHKPCNCAISAKHGPSHLFIGGSSIEVSFVNWWGFEWYRDQYSTETEENLAYQIISLVYCSLVSIRLWNLADWYRVTWVYFISLPKVGLGCTNGQWCGKKIFRPFSRRRKDDERRQNFENVALLAYDLRLRYW